MMMNTERKHTEKNTAQLQEILYQFITLHEQWSEERELLNRKNAEIEHLLSVFVDNVNQFKTLEKQIREHISASIQNRLLKVAETVSEEISKSATQAVEKTTRQLSRAVSDAENVLARYQHDTRTTQWKIIGVSIFTTIVTCLLLVLLLIPKPTLPLSDEQIKYLNAGIAMELIWPKLSKKEQQHWIKLANNVDYASR